MNILISTDIEGVAGVTHREQVRAGNGEYERARLLMTEEANAAIAGAFEAGASTVFVNDSHGDFRNMIADRLDPRARLIQGKPRPFGMMAGIDLGIDRVFLIGYHSRAHGRGILAHTVNSFAFARIEVNGLEVGEAGLYGALAGEFGVPVCLASGDDVFAAENRELLPETIFVETKQASGNSSGVSLSPEASRAAIRAGAAKAGAMDRPKPLRFEGPLQIRIRAQTPGLADLFCQWPTLEREEESTFSYPADSMVTAVRIINCLSAMSHIMR